MAPGLPPGTVTPRAGARPTHVVVRVFGPDACTEHEIADPAALGPLREGPDCLWVEVTGLADPQAILAVGRAFGLHDLSIEDVLDPAQRPKTELYDDYVFVVLRTLAMAEQVESSPLCLFLGDRFVVTLQDVDGSDLAPVRERLRHGRGTVRARGADYLAYALIDSVVDHYFPVIEAFDDHLEQVEDEVLEARGSDPIDLARLARRDLQTIRHAVWPARDVLAALLRDDVARVTAQTRVYLRDCYDHLIQLQEMVEASREVAASLLESYISRVGLTTNEVMRLLTVIATIFIPLTFIAGVYGMNFNPERSPLNMPELDWYWGYPFSLVLMAVVALACLWYFQRKGWFGRAR